MRHPFNDIIFLSPNQRSGRLDILIAKRLESKENSFYGENVTLLTTIPLFNYEARSTLILENMEQTTTSIEDFSHLLEKRSWSINPDHLQLPLLLVRLEKSRSHLQDVQTKGEIIEIKEAKSCLNSCLIEIMRRISVALAVFSFTLMGLAFGLNIGRNPTRRGLIAAMSLGAIFLAAFFSAKNFEKTIYTPAILYFVPHLLIWLASFWRLRQISRGIE